MKRAVAALLAALVVVGAAQSVVQTHVGPVSGEDSSSHRAFKGIPYGRPPVGDLRWTSPQDPASWSQTYRATSPSSMCPGTINNIFDIIPRVEVDEDCLYLNVYTPSLDRLTRPLPVLVWFYGGAFILGDGYEVGAYDGSYIVSHHDVIIVAPNYRLGPFGFLVTESLRGNYGIEDQRFALEWVQKNIAAFGGDPDNVMIYGESAGAMSVGIHMVSPPSAGLFHRALMESNAFGLRYKPRDMAVDIGASFAELVDCGRDDLACLRNVSMAEIAWKRRWVFPREGYEYRLGDILLWGPTLDDEVLPKGPLEAFMESDPMVVDVPLLFGVNKDEAGLFTDLIDIVLNIANAILGTELDITFPPPVFTRLIEGIFKDAAPLVLEQYPPVNPDNFNLFSSLATDYIFRCPSIHAAQGFTARANSEVYSYNFIHTPDFLPRVGNISACFGDLSCHALELPYTWHIESLAGIEIAGRFTDVEEAMSVEMIGYWTSFAAGNVNAHGPNVAWPAFNATTAEHMLIGGAPTFTTSNWDLDFCALFAEIGYIY